MTEMIFLKETLTYWSDYVKSLNRFKYERHDCVYECMHVAEWEDVYLCTYACYWIKQA